ncbi:MAG: two-component regulator propeller domain-containing protein, partial [bacterium]
MNASAKITCLLALLALSHPRPAAAAWQVFSTADGLPSNTVDQVMEDRSGTYWAVVPNGLSRYDGAVWSKFVFPDSQDYTVQCVFQERSGAIWIGRGSYAMRTDGTHWTSHLCGFGVECILEDHAGNIWVGTQGAGVERFNGTNWVRYTTGSGLSSNRVLAIAEDRSGNMWFGSDGYGASRFDGTTWRTFTAPDGLVGPYINAIWVDHRNNVWFGTNDGLTRFDGSTWDYFSMADGLPSLFIRSLAEDRFGNIWAGTGLGGVARYDGQAWQAYGLSDGVPQGPVEDISSDHLGNMWFCIYGGGVVRFDGVEWKNYSYETGLGDIFNPALIRSSVEDDTGTLWFGSIWSGLFSFDGRSWVKFNGSNGLSSSAIRGLAKDSQGRVWVATGNGANVRTGGSWGSLSTGNGLLSNDLITLGADPAGNVWFSSSEGITRYDGDSCTKYTYGAFFMGSSQTITAISADSSGGVLLGGQYQYRYQGGQFAPFRDFTVPERVVYAICVDASGVMWFAEQDRLTRYDGVNWVHFASPGQVLDLAGSDDGTIWLAEFGDGIGMIKGNEVRSFTTAEGLGSNSASTILVDHSGAVWIGTDAGVTRYRPDRVAPRTVVTGRPAPTTAARDIVVSFAAAFGETRGIEFSTSFDGQAWSGWGSVPSWSSTGLADGPHLLEIRSRDHSLNVEAAPVQVAFQIDGTPPTPVLTTPTFGQAVHGVVSFVGTAADPRLLRYTVAVRPAGTTSWTGPGVTTLVASTTSVVNGTLATWDTSHALDGMYDVLTSVNDSLGLVGTDLTTIIVDNVAPFADQTS